MSADGALQQTRVDVLFLQMGDQFRIATQSVLIQFIQHWAAVAPNEEKKSHMAFCRIDMSLAQLYIVQTYEKWCCMTAEEAQPLMAFLDIQDMAYDKNWTQGTRICKYLYCLIGFDKHRYITDHIYRWKPILLFEKVFGIDILVLLPPGLDKVTNSLSRSITNKMSGGSKLCKAQKFHFILTSLHQQHLQLHHLCTTADEKIVRFFTASGIPVSPLGFAVLPKHKSCNTAREYIQ